LDGASLPLDAPELSSSDLFLHVVMASANIKDS
jgi:hypothetical protein